MPSRKILLSPASLIAGTLLMSMSASVPNALAEKAESHRPHIDLAFCIDTTGSMAGEIEAVKTKTKEIVAKLGGSKPAPEIRVGLVAYRDRGDEYVTKVFQFSDNIDKVVKDISSLQANGGGDAPEAVNQALHASVHDLHWSTDKKTVKVLFLIGDAGPHYYPGDYKWDTESKSAIAQGIQINTIACDGLNNSPPDLDIFKKIAKLSDGKCEFLTYRQEVVDAGGHRSTLVSSAGKMFKVDSKSAEAWREGADKLMAKGMAAPMASPVAAAAPMPAGSFAGTMTESAGGIALMDASPTLSSATRGRMMMPTAKAKASGGAGGAAGAIGGYYGGNVSRGDSNLADIVLNATRDAAKKKANIEFKD